MIRRLHLYDIDLFPRRRGGGGVKEKRQRAAFDVAEICGVSPCNRENITLHHSPLADSESFVGYGHSLNEEQIENWASAVPWPAMNTEAASQVISLGCRWLRP